MNVVDSVQVFKDMDINFKASLTRVMTSIKLPARTVLFLSGEEVFEL
jgi:hypothetical protein